jgi:hypothetical protein
MVNPFKNIELKNWPDYWLAVSGLGFIILLGALVAGKNQPGSTVAWVILFGGLLLFGIGGKIAHYKAHIKGVEGNINVWVSKWRHGFLADTLAIIGIILIIYSVVTFLGLCAPNKALVGSLLTSRAQLGRYASTKGAWLSYRSD